MLPKYWRPLEELSYAHCRAHITLYLAKWQQLPLPRQVGSEASSLQVDISPLLFKRTMNVSESQTVCTYIPLPHVLIRLYLMKKFDKSLYLSCHVANA